MRCRTRACVLVVDEDASFCEQISNHLLDLELDVRVTPNDVEALAFILEARPSLVFIDVDLPGFGGLRTAELAMSLHARGSVVLTAKNAAAAERACRCRPDLALAVLEKPVSALQARQLAEVAISPFGVSAH